MFDVLTFKFSGVQLYCWCCSATAPRRVLVSSHNDAPPPRCRVWLGVGALPFCMGWSTLRLTPGCFHCHRPSHSERKKISLLSSAFCGKRVWGILCRNGGPSETSTNLRRFLALHPEAFNPAATTAARKTTVAVRFRGKLYQTLSMLPKTKKNAAYVPVALQ